MTDANTTTTATEVDVQIFLEQVEHPVRRADGLILDQMFQRITGWKPRMWGPTIIGYGAYHYVYETGREGDSLATGFSPRKSNLSLYIMPGYQDFDDMLDRLGKHKKAKACLYINKLADVDLGVLEEIIRAGLVDLGSQWAVTPS